MNPLSPPSDQSRREVLLVVRNFPPVRHSGTIRVESFVSHLPKFGYRPTVLFSSTPEELSSSGDTVLPSEQRLEIPWRIPQGLFRRNLIRLPLVYGLSRRGTRRDLARRSVTLCEQRNYRPDIVLGSCPPGEALVVGQAIAQRFDCPFVADYRDPWSYAPMPLYPHWIDFLAEKQEERRLIKKSSAILTTTEACRHLIEQEFDTPSDRIHILPNGYEASELASPELFAPISQDPNRFHIVYTGEIGKSHPLPFTKKLIQSLGFDFDPLHTHWQARSPRWFLEGLSQWLKDSPDRASQIRVWFIGDSKLSNDPSIRNFDFPEIVRVFPRVPQKVAVGATLQANLLLFLQLETFFRGQPLCMFIAGKLYSYLASGKRILAAVQKSENTELIERFQAGTCVSPTSAEEFARAIDTEFQRWKSGTALPDQPRKIPEFERSYQAGQLARLFDSLLNVSQQSPVSAKL